MEIKIRLTNAEIIEVLRTALRTKPLETSINDLQIMEVSNVTSEDSRDPIDEIEIVLRDRKTVRS